MTQTQSHANHKRTMDLIKISRDNDKDYDFSGGTMTTKEIAGEMFEIFEHKYALTQKINHNVRVIIVMDKAVEEGMVNDTVLSDAEIEKIETRSIQFKKALVVQRTERGKLALSKIAQQLQVSERFIKYEHKKFIDRKEARQRTKDLSFKRYQKRLREQALAA